MIKQFRLGVMRRKRSEVRTERLTEPTTELMGGRPDCLAFRKILTRFGVATKHLDYVSFNGDAFDKHRRTFRKTRGYSAKEVNGIYGSLLDFPATLAYKDKRNVDG